MSRKKKKVPKLHDNAINILTKPRNNHTGSDILAQIRYKNRWLKSPI
jgi:hypothetical protein